MQTSKHCLNQHNDSCIPITPTGQEEYEARKKAESEARRAEEERRAAEERQRREEEERKEEERQREEARVSKLRKHTEGEKDATPAWHDWPTFTSVAQGLLAGKERDSIATY